jgi:hypothetical protein
MNMRTDKTIMEFYKEYGPATKLLLTVDPKLKLASFRYESVDTQVTIPIPIVANPHAAEYFTAVAADTDLQALIASIAAEPHPVPLVQEEEPE